MFFLSERVPLLNERIPVKGILVVELSANSGKGFRSAREFTAMMQVNAAIPRPQPSVVDQGCKALPSFSDEWHRSLGVPTCRV
jgi:hypothetical protein